MRKSKVRWMGSSGSAWVPLVGPPKQVVGMPKYLTQQHVASERPTSCSLDTYHTGVLGCRNRYRDVFSHRESKAEAELADRDVGDNFVV